MKLFIIICLIVFPLSMWFQWFMTGNYGKTTYGNFWNWLRNKEIK